MNMALPPSARKVQEVARALGLDIAVREMPQSTRTAEDAAAACGCAVGQIVKSLIFQGRESGRPYLLLVSGRNRVDQDGIAAAIGEPLLRPDAARVRAWTGYAIGGIPPLAHETPMQTFMDKDLLDHDRVWAAAGTPRTVFSARPQALAQAIEAKVICVA